MSPDVLMLSLLVEGGAIVSSSECTEIEIAQARLRNRFAVDSNGYGFVRRTKEWLDLQKGMRGLVDSAAKVPASHQQRVLDEKLELDERLDKLGKFIDSSPIFAGLPDEERLRLVRQRACMSELSTILAERIEAFPS